MGSSMSIKIYRSGTIRLMMRLLGSTTCDEASNFENYSLFCGISAINDGEHMLSTLMLTPTSGSQLALYFPQSSVISLSTFSQKLENHRKPKIRGIDGYDFPRVSLYMRMNFAGV